MQTFLPYPDFRKSMEALDYRRLGKQRVECLQLLKALDDSTYGWAKHPACKMWKGYREALALYMNTAIDVWVERGYKNTMQKANIITPVELPHWLGNEAFHMSHQSNLKRKDPVFYKHFNVNPDLEYIWPEGK